MTERVCGLCDGTGKRLRRVPGGFVSELVDCFACDGAGTHGPLPDLTPAQGRLL